MDEKLLEGKLSLRLKMIIIAEIYNQNPKHSIFKKFSRKAMISIRALASELQKERKEGKIK